MAPSMLLTAAVLAVLAPTATALYVNGSVTTPCDSPLYCQGDILKAIELAQPFSDSKTFVDMWVSRNPGGSKLLVGAAVPHPSAGLL